MRNDFCVFILSHGRARNVVTWQTLDRCGYTGKRYIVIDDEDDQEEIYRELYGDAVIRFCKREVEKEFDTFDNRDERRTVVFARNACFGIAKELGYKYFLELDDDYTDFEIRYEADGRLKVLSVSDMDGMCDAMLEFLEASGAHSICFAQGGDFIGGVGNSRFRQGILRKAMNSFFCSVDRPFQFSGRINEDVNTYTYEGSIGKLFFTVCRVMLVQMQTQGNDGGMTGVYIDAGTYVKSFYTVICMPSAVSISVMGAHSKRMHHKVAWDYCVPKILSGRWSKHGEG